MSKVYELRSALKDAIVAANIGLSADDIIIERQADIFKKIETTVSKARNGVCLVISAGEKTNLAKVLDVPRWRLVLKLTLWVKPVYYTAGQTPEEDISEGLENLLAQLDLTAGAPNKQFYAFEVLDSREVPDPSFLVRELRVQRVLQN